MVQFHPYAFNSALCGVEVGSGYSTTPYNIHESQIS